MHIKRLAATGVKGRSFAHDLTPLVLFTGPNFSGKTARIEAIRFVFKGYIDELGKQAFSTWAMIDGGVRVEFGGKNACTPVERTITKQGETIRVQENVNDFGNAPLPFLNTEEYFGLTEQERIQYIFRTITVPDSYTVEGIIADLRNLTLEENTEQTEAAKNAVIVSVEKALREQGISSGLTDLTRDKGILKIEFAFYNKRAKETIGAVRTLSELKTAAGDVSAETLESTKTQLEAVSKKLESANQIVGSLSNRAMQFNQVALRRSQIELALAQVVPDRESEIKALQKQAEAIKVPAITREKVKETYDAHQAAEAALTQARTHQDGIIAQIEEVEDAIKELKKLKACPTCKAAGPNWRAAATKEYQSLLKAHKVDLAKGDTAITTLTSKADKAKKAHTKASQDWELKAEAERRIESIKRDIETLRASVRATDESRRNLSQERANLQSISAPSDAEMSAAAAEVQSLNERKTKLEQTRDSIVRLQQNLVSAEEAAAEHQKASSRALVIKKVGETLRDRQAAMIEELFGGLLKTANYFVSGILEGELVFHGGEVGKFIEGRFVSHKTFSGVEKMLTFVAVAAALSKDAPIKLLLLDEVGRMTDAVRSKVTSRLEAAVKEGVLDQVLAVIPSDKIIEIKGWQTIFLDESEPLRV